MGDYADIRGQVSRNLGSRDDTTTYATILFHFNNVQRELAMDHDFKELETEVSGSFTADKGVYTETELSLNTDLNRVREWRVTDSDSSYHEIIEVAYDVWRDQSHDFNTQATGLPVIFTRNGLNLTVDPIPDDTYAYTIYYLKFPTAIATEATDDCDLNCHDLLMAMTTYYTFLTLEDTKMAGVWMGIAEKLLKKYGINDKRAFNFRPFKRSYGSSNQGTGSTPWADPFVRR